MFREGQPAFRGGMDRAEAGEVVRKAWKKKSNTDPRILAHGTASYYVVTSANAWKLLGEGVAALVAAGKSVADVDLIFVTSAQEVMLDIPLAKDFKFKSDGSDECFRHVELGNSLYGLMFTHEAEASQFTDVVSFAKPITSSTEYTFPANPVVERRSSPLRGSQENPSPYVKRSLSVRPGMDRTASPATKRAPPPLPSKPKNLSPKDKTPAEPATTDRRFTVANGPSGLLAAARRARSSPVVDKTTSPPKPEDTSQRRERSRPSPLRLPRSPTSSTSPMSSPRSPMSPAKDPNRSCSPSPRRKGADNNPQQLTWMEKAKLLKRGSLDGSSQGFSRERSATFSLGSSRASTGSILSAASAARASRPKGMVGTTSPKGIPPPLPPPPKTKRAAPKLPPPPKLAV